MATRNTVQQKIVSEALQKVCGMHPSADDIYADVAREHPSISKATVYRVLNKLVENGQATKVVVSNGADRFDARLDPHCHVVCTVCGKVDDVEIDPSLGGIDAQASKLAHGYVIQSHEMTFRGTCPSCQKASA